MGEKQLINLLLVGRAVSNVFDGDKELGDSGAWVVRGLIGLAG